MHPDGLPLLVALLTLTVLGTVAAAVLVPRLRARPGAGWARIGGFTAGRVGVIACCQLLAMAATFSAANHMFGFYTSWGDLFGQDDVGTISDDGVQTGASSSGVVAHRTPSGATLLTVAVRGSGENGTHDVLVWLPRGQHRPGSLPVMMMLPGQPGSPRGVNDTFHMDAVASAAIARGVPPFAVVMAPIQLGARGQECLDLPQGPQVQTWLSKDVPTALERAVPALDPSGRHWAVTGYSTGGYCAATLLVRHPQRFVAAASLGGYFHPWLDGSTGHIGDHAILRENNPLTYVRTHPPHALNLLVAVSEQDRSSWAGGNADSQAMIEAMKGWPGTASLVVPTGGHNFRVYSVMLPQVIDWFVRRGW